MEGSEETTETVFAHADKLIAITPEELAAEMRWQSGRGLVEIIDNVLVHMAKVKHMGALTRICELQMIRNRITDKWPK